MDDADELRRQVRTAIEALRPHPHRGDLIAAGVAPLVLGVLLLNLRLDAAWGTGIFFVLTGLACFVVLGMGVLAPMESERPRAYQQVLLLGGLLLLFVTLFRLDQIFGVRTPLGGSGSTFWIFFLVTGASVWCARERRSAICALAAALSGGVTLLAFVAWVFHADGPTTVRWILFLFALGLLLGALVLRDGRRKESVYLVDAAAIAMLGVGTTYLGPLLAPDFADVGRSVSPGAGWSLILLAAGLGLIAYAGVDEEPGPAYLGALNLGLFLVIDGIPGVSGGSLWFWPIVLLLAGGGMIAAGLRPRVELPPEPGAERDAEPVVPGPFPGRPPSAGAAVPESRGPSPVTPPGPSTASATPPAPIAPPAAPAPEPAPTANPEPPAPGSLWARADVSEDPTEVHDAPTEVRPPRPPRPAPADDLRDPEAPDRD